MLLNTYGHHHPNYLSDAIDKITRRDSGSEKSAIVNSLMFSLRSRAFEDLWSHRFWGETGAVVESPIFLTATPHRARKLLKAALNHAYQEGRVAHDDAWRRVRAFREADPARICYLSDEQCRRLVAACDEDFRSLVIAALLTGCRYAEIANLVAEDFNPDSGTIRIQTSKSW